MLDLREVCSSWTSIFPLDLLQPLQSTVWKLSGREILWLPSTSNIHSLPMWWIECEIVISKSACSLSKKNKHYMLKMRTNQSLRTKDELTFKAFAIFSAHFFLNNDISGVLPGSAVCSVAARLPREHPLARTPEVRRLPPARAGSSACGRPTHGLLAVSKCRKPKVVRLTAES